MLPSLSKPEKLLVPVLNVVTKDIVPMSVQVLISHCNYVQGAIKRDIELLTILMSLKV